MNAEERVKQQQQEVDDWNAKHQVGAAVTLLKDDGSTVETKTRSKAEVLSGHTAVIWLEGISGCYLLARMLPVASSDFSDVAQPPAADAPPVEAATTEVVS